MKIAIIGAGISGLSAAHRLSQNHEITVYESAAYAGGHTNTVDVEVDGERFSIDTGFIVFNDWTYPNFIALLNELGVASSPTSMSFSVRCDDVNLEYNGSSLNGVFAQRRNLFRPWFHRMLRDILRFNREAPLALSANKVSDETTVKDFLAEHGYSPEFAGYYLLPMGAAIWSCPPGTFELFPIRFIIQFYGNHGLLSLKHRPTWRVIDGGSRTYVHKMLARFGDRVRLSCPVTSVSRGADGVQVTSGDGDSRAFDHVVFACHSDQALRMLTDATPIERTVLSAFPYTSNVAVLHTDESVLPRRRRAWASWNYHLSTKPDQAANQAASVTYCMNILQHIKSKQTFNVTLNGEHLIAPARVLGKFTYDHPVFTTQRAAAQARHRELINVNRSSYCGAYWGNGFHEDGVVSALRVVEALNSQGARA